MADEKEEFDVIDEADGENLCESSNTSNQSLPDDSPADEQEASGPRCFNCLQDALQGGAKGSDFPLLSASPDPQKIRIVCSECGRLIPKNDYMAINSMIKASIKMGVIKNPIKRPPIPKRKATYDDDDDEECSSSVSSGQLIKGIFPCKSCTRKFKTSSGLAKHMKTVHGFGSQPLKCLYCDKTFGFNCEREKHMRSHTGARPYKCSQCDMAFALSCNMRRHMRTHNKDESFSCEYCGRNLQSKRSLTRHILVLHSGDESHRCHLCGVGFPVSNYLKKHLQKHASGKIPCDPEAARAALEKKQKQNPATSSNSINCSTNPNDPDSLMFKCYICQLLFSTQDEVVAHLQTHEDPDEFNLTEIVPIKTENSEENQDTNPETNLDANPDTNLNDHPDDKNMETESESGSETSADSDSDELESKGSNLKNESLIDQVASTACLKTC